MGELGQESRERPCLVLENPAWLLGRAHCLWGLLQRLSVGWGRGSAPSCLVSGS